MIGGLRGWQIGDGRWGNSKSGRRKGLELRMQAGNGGPLGTTAPTERGFPALNEEGWGQPALPEIEVPKFGPGRPLLIEFLREAYFFLAGGRVRNRQGCVFGGQVAAAFGPLKPAPAHPVFSLREGANPAFAGGLSKAAYQLLK